MAGETRSNRHACDLPDRDLAIIGHLRRFWEGLRIGHDLPHRLQITPAGLGPALGHAVLIERTAPGAVRIRLAGSALIDRMGMDLRGMDLTALILPDHRARLARSLARVFAMPATLEAPVMSGGTRGQLVILPLAGGTLALGALWGADANAQPPQRLALGPVMVEPLAGPTTARAHLRLVSG